MAREFTGRRWTIVRSASTHGLQPIVSMSSSAVSVEESVERLSALVGVRAREVRLRKRLPPTDRLERVDAILRAGKLLFVLEIKGSGGAAPIAAAAEQVRAYAMKLGSNAIPVLVVPYMGEAGRRLCEQSGVGWLDLSGNARIVAPGLHVVVEGKPNRFKRSGRPSSVFAPKSSRIARWFLTHPGRPVAQRDLASATGMDEGFTSRIVRRLQEDELVVKDSSGALRVRNYDVMLDAWREAYDFTKHAVLMGHIPARSGEELLRRISEGLEKRRVTYAATGLAAAWLYTRFAAFRVVTVYLKVRPEAALLEALSFREAHQGSNMWLVLPKDEGVFHGVRAVDRLQCVHPIQVYLDLKAHPERASEAAERLREQFSGWSLDA